MYNAIIFDMDGVIIDSEPLWEQSEKILINNYGMDYKTDYRDKILGLNQSDSARLIRETFNLKLTIQEIIQKRLDILLSLYNKELKLIDGIEKILDESTKNFKVGLASSSPKNIIEFVLDKFEISKYFQSVVSGDCTKNGKPEPDIYLEAAKQLRTKPENCIVVEDSINGVLAAKNAGMYCIAIPDKKLEREKYEMADLIVDNFFEIRIDEIS
ncbi:MAG: HAD family hydrolase [Thermodesulfobacteriota bacterium]